MSQSKQLSEQFMLDYHEFIKEFDTVVEDLFQGIKLEQLAKSFLESHQTELASFPYPKEYKFPHCNYQDTLQEDLVIVNGDIKSEGHSNGGGSGQGDNSDANTTLANIYRRVCEGTYLRITYNNSRCNLQEDRNEAVDFGRHAIRFSPNNYQACYWFMISIGWKLDATTNAKERTVIARIFRDISRRCIKMDPKDPLPHNLLGRYYYHVGSLSWLERTVAKNLLGASLDGTYQDAEREFRAAHQIRSWSPTGLWMARVLLAQKRPLEEIKEWIDMGLELDTPEPTTEIERRELVELKAKLKLPN